MNRPNYTNDARQQYYREYDNIYINLNQAKSLYAPSATPVVAKFDIQNNTPLLDDASQYYVSIIRFELPLDGIPILIAPVLPFPNTHVEITAWTIGIRLNGVIFNRNLEYYREYVPASGPNGPFPVTPTADNPAPHGAYWFIYEFTTVINMVNVALSNACGDAGIATPHPYFFIDPATEIISVVVPTAFTTIGVPSPFPIPVVNRPEIVMNPELFNLFETFANYNEPTGFYLLLNGFYFPPRTDNAYYLSATATGPTAPPTTFIFKQESPMLQLWSDVKDILFLTNRLPISSETITLGDEGNTANIPILTDYVPSFSSGKELRELIYYVPTGQYRLTDLLSTVPIQSFDLSIYWRSIYDDVFPIPINIGREVNVKLGFLRKDLYKKPNML